MTSIINDEFDVDQLLNFDDVAENFDWLSATSSDPLNETVLPESGPHTTGDSWMGELEELLMRDDYGSTSDCFQVSDLLLDFPEGDEEEEVRPPSSEPEVFSVVGEGNNSPGLLSLVNGGHCNCNVNVGVNDKESSPNSELNCENEKGNSPNCGSNCENDKSSDDAPEVNDDDEDPVSKKRKRQSRNREAAMKSRERKKVLVKELEMKSRYFEEECRRLQSLLHCCYAENQWLRCSLQSYAAPMTKPESAVLLLESLLLGSLVWLMVNICLFPQTKLPLLNQDAARLVSAVLETVKLRGKGTKMSEVRKILSFTRGRRCRASRTKMKSYSAVSCF